jgi:hypothetical protein
VISETPSSVDGQFDEEGDWLVRQFIDAADLQREPEEYVARHSHLLGCFAFDRYRFSDPDLGHWVRRVSDLLASEQKIERCRERFLSTEELAIVRRQAVEDL